MKLSRGYLDRILKPGMLVVTIILASDARPQPLESGVTDDILIHAESEINSTVKVGEPFEYVITVDYRPDKIKPDFRKLLRDVVLHPFEQIHRTRTLISDTEIGNGVRRYQLSYNIVAVNIVPGQSYTIDPLIVHYLQLDPNREQKIEIETKSITIDQYLSDDFLTVPFQALKGVVQDNSTLKRISIIIGILVFLAGGIGLTTKAVLRPVIKGRSFSDISRQRFESVQGSDLNRKQKIINYERLILSMLKHYLNMGARYFWSASGLGSADEGQNREQLKNHLQSGYRVSEPDDRDMSVIEGGLISLYTGIEQKAARERIENRLEREGTVSQRIKKNKTVFLLGVVLVLIAITLFLVLINPHLWVNSDVQVFNNWIETLPERLLAEDNQEDLDILDVQVLGNISEQQRVLESLQSDQLRSAYLYNYGTLVAKVFRKLITMPPEDEEDEAAEPPSFEFPLLLLSNAVRFYPYDEDTRRNLEIVILLKENEEEKGTDDIQGELGPPTPGFSRDMNQLLF